MCILQAGNILPFSPPLILPEGKPAHSHLHPELPHATHRHPGNGTKVVGGNDGALLGATHTRHTLQEKTRDTTNTFRAIREPATATKYGLLVYCAFGMYMYLKQTHVVISS